jgi:hypothetical protein
MGRLQLTLATRPHPQLPGPDQPPRKFWRFKAVLTLFLFVSALIGLFIAALVLGSIIAALLLILVAIAALVLVVRRALRLRRPL